jgi:hypothetical protein
VGKIGGNLYLRAALNYKASLRTEPSQYNVHLLMPDVNYLPLFNTAGRAKLDASHPHSLSIFMKLWLNYVILCHDGDSEKKLD